MTNRLKDLTFVDHLDELRARIIKSCAALMVSSCFIYAFIEPILDFVIQPVGQLVFITPTEAFISRLTLAIILGLLLALPVIVYQIWQFVSIGLKEEEKRHILLYGPLSVICFLLGGLFAYAVILPIAMDFLLGFSTSSIVPMITVHKYISFVGSLILAFGIVFELPVVLMFLTKIGIATPAFLIQKRKHAIVIILVISALLTPPDIFTQILMAGPLILLYEIGILVSKLTYKSGAV